MKISVDSFKAKFCGFDHQLVTLFSALRGGRENGLLADELESTLFTFAVKSIALHCSSPTFFK